MYDEVFNQLQAQAAHPGRPLDRLRLALNLLARLMRSNGPWIGRVWTDAGSGELVACNFLRANAPRHLQLLMLLAAEAAAAGELGALPPMQRFAFMMGSVLAPMVLVPGALRMGVLPAEMAQQFQIDVLSDAAIAERVDRALATLAMPC